MDINIQLSTYGPSLSRMVAGVMKWGVWGANFDTQEYLTMIEACLEMGVTTFDHADIYGHNTTEAEFGEALKLKPHLREKMELVTKCGIKLISPNRPNHKIKSYDTSKEHIVWSAENSLKALHTDYIDLLLIHRPSPLMAPDEIAEAFAQLRSQGKVRYFGVSNFTSSQFELLNSSFELKTNQIEASALHLDPLMDGTLDTCLRHRIRPMAWSPLGGGAIFTDLEGERTTRIRKVGEALMKKYNLRGIDQVLLIWLMQHPAGILPVLGTSKAGRIKDAVDAVNVKFTQEEWFEILAASVGEEVA